MVFMSHQGLLLFSCMCGIHYFRPISAFLSRNVQSVVKSSTIFQKSRLSFTSLSSSSGHDYNSGNTIPPEIEQLMLRIRTHQESVPRPTYAEEVRTLIENSIKYGVLSTNSDQFPGFPTGSVVGFELDDNGLPFFVFSSMSAHTKDIQTDGRCSLTVLANDFKGAAQGRVVLIGTTEKVTDEAKRKQLREKYLAKHKDAFWVDFGDFTYYAMTSLETVRFIGGFAMAGSVSAPQYQSALPDPVAAYAPNVIKHMNDDHADSVVAIVKHYLQVPCYGAELVGMDKLGMTIKAKIMSESQESKVRVGYPGGIEVTERKKIKDVIVEMTNASAGSGSA